MAGLTAESAFLHALFPVDPETGRRVRRPSVAVLDDPDSVDAFFARQGNS